MRNTKRAALWAAPLSLALLLAACGSDDGDDAATTTTTTEAPTASTEATTASSETTAPPETPTTGTTPPPTSGTTPPPATEPPATAPPSQAGEPLPEFGGAWANELVRAWGSGDRERAAELADPSVVDQLFGHADPGGDDWEPQGCDGAAGTTYCTFTSASRGETLRTGQSAPNGVSDPIHTIELS